jgi:hypothetical protein
LTTHLVIPDPHAHPDFSNERADWLGQLIKDLKPDVVVNLGDQWDMASMASYDKGKKSFNGRSYYKDLNSGRDFDERLWAPIRKAKRKKPRSIFIEGNHEFRLKRLLEMQPELEGTVSFSDFDLKKNYNDIVEYDGQTPGIIEVDGIHYAHFFVSGVMGRPIGGEHPAYSLLTKQYSSCTCGHIHTTDFSTRTGPDGRRIMGLVAGVYQDYNSPWAGEINKLWWRGVVIKRNVEDGCYDPQWVSVDQLRKEYGRS